MACASLLRQDVRVQTAAGQIRWHEPDGRGRFFGSVLAWQTIGLEEVWDGVWRVCFGPQLLACHAEIADDRVEVPVPGINPD